MNIIVVATFFFLKCKKEVLSLAHVILVQKGPCARSYKE